MFFCAISGEPPQDAVISQKSGHVYERRLIIKYIEENGTEPITGDKLEESDLITIQASEFFFRHAAVVRMVLSNDDSFAKKLIN